jgi:error-prone DNA polymerase
MVAGGLVTHARPHHFPVQEVIGCAHNLSLIHEVKGRKPRFHEDGFPFRSINAERFLRTPFEINELYSEIPELVSNSLQLLSKCDKDVMPSRTTLPKLFDDPENALREVTYAGAHQKYPLMTTGIRRRIDLEVERICRLQYADHFLTIWDACRWASRRGYQFSGRGSVVDSVVAYCLDLSRIDAYKHRLHFDRFLPADGTKRPDIDIDFPAKRRNEVRSYMVQKYGEERVATVAAIGAYCTRGIIREVGKVFGLPHSTISFLSKRVHGGIAPDKLEAALEKRPELRGSNIPKERFRWVLSLAERMMDIPRNMRAHSSGVVISSRPLHETVPVMWSATEDPNGGNLRIIQWDKRLCLRGQDVLEGTQDRVVVRDRTFDVANLPSDDPDVYATMRSGELIGIPQSASPAMRQAHIRLKTKNLEDASLVQAGIRPGVGGAVKLNEMIARRHGKPFTFSHPDLEEILGITYGIIVFQEQVDQLLQKFAGYSGGEAEDTREQIHKRRREDFGREIRERVIQRIQAKGYGLQIAEEVFELIAGFKGYGFAQGHALAFAEISVRSIYCQQHYAAEYFASLLDAQPAGYYGPCTLVNEARNRGVAVLPVAVNLSEVGFAVENVKSTMDPKIVVPNGGIRVALAQISGLNRDLQLRISLTRPFKSIFDFAMKTNPSRDDLERLILVGAFDELHPNRRQLLWALPAILDYARAYNTPGTLPLGAPIPLLPEDIVDFNQAERAIHERRYLDLDIDQHLMSFERERVASRGGVTTTVARRLEHGRKAIVVGNPIRLRFPPTPSGKRVVFFDLEDETGLLNVTCFDETYQRDGHAIVCSPYVTIIGEAQVRDDHVAFLASRVFPYKPHIITLLGVPDAAKTGASDIGWGHSPLPIVTADFLVG